MSSHGRATAERVEEYLEQYASEEGDDIEVILYGVEETGNGPRITTPSHHLSTENGEEYGVVLRTDNDTYVTDIDTFTDAVYDEPAADATIDTIADALDEYDIDAETTLLNGHHPELEQQLEEELVEESYNLWNPVHGVKYFSTQLTRAEKREDELHVLTPRKSRELEWRRKTALAGSLVPSLTQLGAVTVVGKDNPDLAWTLLMTGTATLPYSSSAAGKYLKRVLSADRYQEEPEQ